MTSPMDIAAACEATGTHTKTRPAPAWATQRALETIGRYFNNRLKGVFAGVVEQPGVLKNKVNCPLYLLCFAVGNKRGKDIAIRIADHLLKGVR